MLLFPQRLRWLREKNNWTQKELAEKIGVSQQYYNKFEKGTGQPNLETLFRIRHILGESLDFIVGYHLEDIKAEKLYDLYVESRMEREEAEEEFELAQDYLEDKDLKERLKIHMEYLEGIKKLKDKEDKALNAFFDHLISIPGAVGEYSDKEFWTNRYIASKSDRVRLEKEFMEEYEKL